MPHLESSVVPTPFRNTLVLEHMFGWRGACITMSSHHPTSNTPRGCVTRTLGYRAGAGSCVGCAPAGLHVADTFRDLLMKLLHQLPPTIDYLSIGIPTPVRPNGCPVHCPVVPPASPACLGANITQQMLRGVPWNVYTFRTITVSLVDLRGPDYEAVVAFMQGHGYNVDKSWVVCGGRHESLLTEMWFVRGT